MSIELGAYNEAEGDVYEYPLILQEDRFELSSGGFKQFPWGSDSVSGLTFEVETHYRTDMNIFNFNWTDIVLDGAKNFKIRVTDNFEDGQLDWINEDGSIFWEWLDEKAGWDDPQFRDWMSKNVPGF